MSSSMISAISIIAFTQKGQALGQKLVEKLEKLEKNPNSPTLHVPPRLATASVESYENLQEWIASRWQTGNTLAFIGATGIAVRGIAPFVQDKFTDPAVLSVDEQGNFVVPLLSGHMGGGNEMAVLLSQLLDGQPVISTATDLNGVFAVDVWAKKKNLTLFQRDFAKEVSASLLEGKEVGFCSDFGDECPVGLISENAIKTPELGIWVTAQKEPRPFKRCLYLVPRCLVLGIGCRKGTSVAVIEEAVKERLEQFHLSALSKVVSIDLKAEETGILAFCANYNLSFQTFSAEELMAVEGDFSSSSFVASVTGADNVCERSASLVGGKILLEKWAKNGVTLALAEGKRQKENRDEYTTFRRYNRRT